MQITKETKKLKGYLQELNACRSLNGGSVLQIQDISDPIKIDIALSSTSVPLQQRRTKREAIDLFLTIE